MRRVIALMAAALLGALSMSPALACGKVRMWTRSYLGCGESNQCRERKLVELSGWGGYFGKQSDRFLLPVLEDAVARGLDNSLAQRVFDRYRCIPGARSLAGYDAVMRALDTAKCPSPDDLRHWFEVRVSGAHLGAAPDKGAKKIGWILKGQVMQRQGTAGAWYRIITWAHSSSLTGYVHASLVKPY